MHVGGPGPPGWCTRRWWKAMGIFRRYLSIFRPSRHFTAKRAGICRLNPEPWGRVGILQTFREAALDGRALDWRLSIPSWGRCAESMV